MNSIDQLYRGDKGTTFADFMGWGPQKPAAVPGTQPTDFADYMGTGGLNTGSAPVPGAATGGAQGLPGFGGLVNGAANPYLQQMGNNATQQLTDQYRTTAAPQMASQALAAGGFGSSRQGVVEANALNDLQKNTAGALTNLYGQGYNTALNYDLGMRNAANSYDLGLRNNASQYDLGLRNNDLQYAGLDRQIYNDNMNWQLQGTQLGLGLLGQLQSGNALGQQAGGAIQNTPLNYWQNFSNQANSIGQGFASQSQSGGGGNPLLGALGGAQLGQSIYNNWNSGQNGPALGSNGYSSDGGFFGAGGWGTGIGGVGT